MRKLASAPETAAPLETGPMLFAVNTEFPYATVPKALHSEALLYDCPNSDEIANLCLQSLRANSPAHSKCQYCFAVKGEVHSCNGWHLARLTQGDASHLCLCYSELSLLRMNYTFCPRIRTALVKNSRLLEGVLNGLTYLTRAIEAGEIQDSDVAVPFPCSGQFKISAMSLHSIFRFYETILRPNKIFVERFQEHTAESVLENVSYLSTQPGKKVVRCVLPFHCMCITGAVH